MNQYYFLFNNEEIELMAAALKDKLFQYEKEIDRAGDREILENCIGKALKIKYLIGKLESKEAESMKTEREKELEQRVETLLDIIQLKRGE